MAAKLAIGIKVLGRVQGVFFRASTRKKALELGVAGWVRNDPDGGVYIEAEASEEVLDQFIAWCRRGPEYAIVDDVIINREKEVKEYESFKIEH